MSWTNTSDTATMGGETGSCLMEFIAVPTEQLSELNYPNSSPNQNPLPNAGNQTYIWFAQTLHDYV